MDLILNRKESRADGIFGELVDARGDLVAITLEHAYPADGGKFEPKIKAGKYKCIRYLSPAHKYELFLLTGDLDGDGFNADGRYFELHIGNYNEDSDGCVLVGTGIGFKSDHKGKMITASGIAFKKIMKLQDGLDSFFLVVNDND